MTYRIPSHVGYSEYTEKRSRFLGVVRPVDTEEDARAVLAEIRRERYDARHNCWCYRIRNGAERYSDDGEPQGTAGLPMLEVLQKEDVTNIVCVVTRYFGGILLGTGGLFRAYTKAARDALHDAGISEVRRWTECAVSCPYSYYERIRSEVLTASGLVEKVDYGADVSFSLHIPEETFPIFCSRITDLSSASIDVIPSDTVLRSVPVPEDP